uniref:Uncharacterized protein n=1 Tax=viral metagenome TaxID=1070528 RepID=A0A6M3X494_9ZZZZ
MDKEKLDEIRDQARALGDAQGQCAIQKCKLFAPLHGDSHGLSYIATDLEASYAIVKKWAQAGHVLASGIFPEEGPYSIDYYAEVGNWSREEWETVADLTDWADLNAADLKKLRTFVQKMREGGKHWCPCCDHGRFKEWLADTTEEVSYQTTVQAGEPQLR